MRQALLVAELLALLTLNKAASMGKPACSLKRLELSARALSTRLERLGKVALGEQRRPPPDLTGLCRGLLRGYGKMAFITGVRLVLCHLR